MTELFKSVYSELLWLNDELRELDKLVLKVDLWSRFQVDYIFWLIKNDLVPANIIDDFIDLELAWESLNLFDEEFFFSILKDNNLTLQKYNELEDFEKIAIYKIYLFNLIISYVSFKFLNKKTSISSLLDFSKLYSVPEFYKKIFDLIPSLDLINFWTSWRLVGIVDWDKVFEPPKDTYYYLYEMSRKLSESVMELEETLKDVELDITFEWKYLLWILETSLFNQMIEHLFYKEITNLEKLVDLCLFKKLCKENLIIDMEDDLLYLKLKDVYKMYVSMLIRENALYLLWWIKFDNIEDEFDYITRLELVRSRYKEIFDLVPAIEKKKKLRKWFVVGLVDWDKKDE